MHSPRQHPLQPLDPSAAAPYGVTVLEGSETGSKPRGYSWRTARALPGTAEVLQQLEQATGQAGETMGRKSFYRDSWKLFCLKGH